MKSIVGWMLVVIGGLIFGLAGIVPLFIDERLLELTAPVAGLGGLSFIIGAIVLFFSRPRYRDKNIEKLNPYAENNFSFSKIDLLVTLTLMACFGALGIFINRITIHPFLLFAIATTSMLSWCFYIYKSIIQKKKRRTAKVAALAESIQGSTYEKRSRRYLDISRLKEQGDKQRAFNGLSWNLGGHDIDLFDFCFYLKRKVGENDDSYSRTKTIFVAVSQTIAVINKPLAIPFQLIPRTASERISEAFGKQVVEFVDTPDFNEIYSLTCDDDYEVKKLFTLAARQKLIEDPGWRVESDGERLMVYRDQKLYKVKAWPILAQKAVDVFELLNSEQR